VDHDGALVVLEARGGGTMPNAPARFAVQREVSLPGERLYALATSSAGSSAGLSACGGSGGRVHLIDDSGALLASVAAGVGAVNTLAIAGDALWVGGSSGAVCAFSVRALLDRGDVDGEA